jgi:hypothetical protein
MEYIPAMSVRLQNKSRQNITVIEKNSYIYLDQTSSCDLI